MQRRDRVQTRETLLNDVWGLNLNVETRTIDTHIKRLREKLGKAGRSSRRCAVWATASEPPTALLESAESR